MQTEATSSKLPCPCGSAKLFSDCCLIFLQGDRTPDTAEQLMRSRYSAYATFNLDYVKNTWHPDTLPADLRLVPGQVWIGLKIKRTEAGGITDTSGIVAFEAKSKRGGRARKMKEVSRFEKIDSRWYYVSGDYSAN